MSESRKYTRTILASYIGYVTQAIVNNFVPLLFLQLAREFALSLEQLTLLTTVNFAVQLAVDLLCTRAADRVGYRPCVVAAHVFAAAGLIGLSLADSYGGILACVVLYAVGGGLIEVLISPIVESCPTEHKEAAMSLLHSFYCWGHVAVILLSTLFFATAGIGRWRVLALLWALIPAANGVFFTRVPLWPVTPDNAPPMPLGRLLRRRVFWVLILLMICAGASEQAMSQWASAFAERALRVSKTVGDLAGPCAFALLMGTARAIYGKLGSRIPLRGAMAACAGLCVLSYLLAALTASPWLGLAGCALCGFSVGLFWPGTFSAAAQSLPAGGTPLFALLALAGDIGCSGGPTLVGFIAGASGADLRAGLIWGIVFPVLILLGLRGLKPRDAA